ncbi:tetratricopeptide repeat protein [Desulfovibrio ferrophilus]|uniref:TPR repeat-containing protein n=1 Tax=Desulfovibrio ferrophilus TaxID=241368 RepID=A0A2Z6AV92_9BACT|nr:tetratricopeptide repeat protein [Desulfovibrio ferrophilus]BBD07151.1 TPR repeat-containing protein [Desulfovibrio ferrophilus]
MSEDKNTQQHPKERQIDHGADQKIKGVFSTQTVQRVGTGTTTRKTVKKTFWMVDEQEACIEIQPLNINYIPSGPKRKVPKEDFLEKFSPEPEFYVSTVFPKMKELTETVDKGDKHREKGETFSAELEYEQAINLDEDNVRANFGLGLTYLERGDDSKANDIFERLVKLDAAFETEHKHLFNEFGINLRKNKMYEQSVDYYERAMELSTTDENLHYNIARAYYEREQFGECALHLKMAIDMNKDFAEAAQFLKFLQDNKLVDEDGNTRNGVAKPVTKKKAKKNSDTNYSMDV